jgi:hypothetical protein
MSLTHLEPTQPPAPAISHPTGEPVTLAGELALWREAYQFAEAIARTPFVPSGMRGEPAAVMACIIKGHELGISALHALQAIFTIEGRVGLSAEVQRAMIVAAGHEIWTDEYSETRVTLCGQRRGSQHIQRVTWTIQDAERAHLSGKPVWRSYPRDMLLARASGALARLMFADVLAGMSYNREELVDLASLGQLDQLETLEPTQAPAGEIAAPKPRARRTRKAAAPAGSPAGRAATAGPQTSPPPSGGPPPPLPGEDGYTDPEPPGAAEPAATPPDAGERHSGADPVESEARAARDTASGTTSGEPEALVRSRAMEIARQARGAGVDHHDVIRAVTHGRYSSAKDVDAAQADDALHAIAAIHRGSSHLEIEEDDDGRHVDLVDGPDPSKVEEYQARVRELKERQAQARRGGQQQIPEDPEEGP